MHIDTPILSCCRCPRGSLPSSISLPTKVMPRSSDISEELNVISLIRAKISSARLRHLLALQRVDLDQQQVLGLRRADQRIKGRIAHVAAVPIGLTVDLDGAEQMRQAGRGDDHVGRHFIASETRSAPVFTLVADTNSCQILAATHRVKIDEALDQILQRIDVERIEVVGRQISRQRLHPQADRRIFDRPE